MDALSPRQAALQAPERLALITDEQRFTFVELWQRAEAMLEALPWRAQALTLAFVAEPRWQTVALVWALLENGIPFVPLHPKWSADDCALALADVARVSARTVVRRPLPAGGLVQKLERHEIDALGRLARASSRTPRRVGSGALASILFSSGTTSRPRGVLLSRAAFIASAAAHSSNLPFQPSDRWLLALPFAHVGGLSIITRALISRTCVVLIGSSDRAEMLAAIERHSVSLLSLVPTVARDLLKEDRSDVLRTPRAVLLGGARAPLLLRKELKARGVRALASYGMTETCSQIATQGLADADDADSESCGLPLAGFELRIVDDAGASRNAGESGRIQVRGPALMRGYLGQAMVAPRAFFDTRDVGYLDERGHLFVVGRADETIVTGGENVFPAEVEAAMAGLAGVREVAAFGVPDERWGEIVAVALVLEPGADLDAIWQQARARLSSFRRPRRFAVAPSLPRSPNGKIDRRGLLRLPLAEVSS